MTREELEKLTKQVTGDLRTQLESNKEKKEETISDLMNRWIVNVRAYDNENQNNPFFRNKPRGYGQEDGSTDGRLRRKLIMKLAENYARDENETNNENLNKRVATRLGNFLPLLTSEISQPLKKALYLTTEKLIDPLGYKQKYARVVPFGENKWVKASKRFHTLTNRDLPLKRSYDANGKEQLIKTSMTKTALFPENLSNFTNAKLIDDVGQIGIGECALQASAASLPRQTLENMFSWKPAYKDNGTTVRLYNEAGNPMYIRLNNQLWHDKSDHKARWPFVLSAAVAKAAKNDDIQELRNETKDLYDNNTGLPMYSLQDVNGFTGEKMSMLLKGKPLNSNEMKVFRGSGISRSEKNKEVNELLKSVKPKNAAYPMGVVSMNKMRRDSHDTPLHALLLEDYDPRTETATLVNPWEQSEIDNINKKDPTRKLKRRFNTSDFSNVDNIFFLPEGADPANNIYVNRTSPPKWRQRNLVQPSSRSRSRLGNINHTSNTNDTNSEL